MAKYRKKSRFRRRRMTKKKRFWKARRTVNKVPYNGIVNYTVELTKDVGYVNNWTGGTNSARLFVSWAGFRDDEELD